MFFTGICRIQNCYICNYLILNWNNFFSNLARFLLIWIFKKAGNLSVMMKIPCNAKFKQHRANTSPEAQFVWFSWNGKQSANEKRAGLAYKQSRLQYWPWRPAAGDWSTPVFLFALLPRKKIRRWTPVPSGEKDRNQRRSQLLKRENRKHPWEKSSSGKKRISGARAALPCLKWCLCW